MKPENFDVQELIDYLQGTTNTLDDGMETLYSGMDFEELTEEDHDQIDNQIFECEVCGWWCEISEQHEGEENGICDDCFNN